MYFRPSQISFTWLVFAVFAAICHAVGTHRLSPEVDLGYATYRGEHLPIGVTQFLGMRYAAPPLGDLRFRAPHEPVAEAGVQDATQHGDICYSIASGGPPVPSSEDCLFVDVYAPASATRNSKLPVMVWLSGGAFVQLFNPNYNGTGLIKASNDGVLVVTLNYRVGPYGFLASEDVRADGDLNVGLLDQQKALEWVTEHIASFGGDPAKVTIFGTSISSVFLNMLAHGGDNRGLFRAGISAAPYMPSVYEVSDLEFQYEQLLNATGCDSLTCLRSVPSEKLQAANIYRPFPSQTQAPLFPYMPVVDGNLLQGQPSALLKAGKIAKVPLLTGTSGTEGTIFAPQANTTSDINVFLRAQYPRLTDEDLAAINCQYEDIPYGFTPPGVKTKEAPLFYRAAAIYGDVAFECQAYEYSNALQQTDIPVYTFLDEIRDPVEVAAGFIVPYTWELQGVWGPQYATNYVALEGADAYEGINAKMVSTLQGYWTSFAKTGMSPNTYRAKHSPEWSKYAQGREMRLRTNETRMEVVSQKQLERCQFWKGLRDKTQL
ncbi:triacylglycerol lipase-like protein [Pseudovirgaria hyperparasitica]|uniref:Triacylglycerol lipase-like protein n=1 Tax=Pseudovirgaria hyperparasitica TaxID=470096 RepID=A0A6A6VW30_9PEZI|nr:triacylglycerol lipase-like protein [Pseudovirgaria hyperparasitica]KAF2753850.1 triacylglycerol lipase-like protein [Pseudovirgaria hyperparasitica]